MGSSFTDYEAFKTLHETRLEAARRSGAVSRANRERRDDRPLRFGRLWAKLANGDRNIAPPAAAC